MTKSTPKLCPKCKTNVTIWDAEREVHLICTECQNAMKKAYKHVGALTNVPERYKEANVNDFPKKFISGIFDSTKLHKKTTDNQKMNLVMYGDCGTGKTHLMCAVCNYLSSKGHDPYFVVWNELIKNVYKRYNTYESEEYIEFIINKPILFIDDLFTEKQTDNKSNLLFRIVNERYNKMLPTIVSFNGDVSDLFNIDNRSARRLADDGGVTLEVVTNYKKGDE